MKYPPVLLLLTLFTLLSSCKERPPYPEEYSDNAEFLYNITIIKEPKIVSISNIDGKIKASLFERNKEPQHNYTLTLDDMRKITLDMTNIEVASFEDIIRKQLEPNALLAVKEAKAAYKVKFRIGNISNEMSGLYQSSSNFNDISPEFGKFMKTILQNKTIKDFLEK